MPELAPLTITNRQLIELDRGLSSLDAIRSGRDEIINFEFSDDTKYAIVHAAVVVRRAKETYDAFARAKAAELGVYEGLEKTQENALKVRDLNAALEAAKEKPVTLDGITPIKASDLLARPGDPKKPAKNNIPSSVLTNLWPILEWNAA